MTPRQIDLVKQSWHNIQESHPQFAEIFYARLFELYPDLRSMFLNNLSVQKIKLTATLSFIAQHLGDPVTLLPKVQQLGMTHSGYGVREEHYEQVGQALFWALKQSLGKTFDEDTEQAWSLAYQTLADAMMSADIDSAIHHY